MTKVTNQIIKTYKFKIGTKYFKKHNILIGLIHIIELVCRVHSANIS